MGLDKARVQAPTSLAGHMRRAVGIVLCVMAASLLIFSAYNLGQRDHVAALLLFLSGAAFFRLAMRVLAPEIQE